MRFELQELGPEGLWKTRLLKSQKLSARDPSASLQAKASPLAQLVQQKYRDAPTPAVTGTETEVFHFNLSICQQRKSCKKHSLGTRQACTSNQE